MARFLHPTALIPGGLVVDRIICEEERFILLARRPSSSASCPSCGKLSNRRHSRYQRALADLPSSGRSVLLRVTVRRFRCDTETCNMNIFAERFEAAVVERYARRSARLECIVYQLGLALGGRGKASHGV